MSTSVSSLRRLSGKEDSRSSSWRWGIGGGGGGSNNYCGENRDCGEGSLKQMEGLNIYGGGDNGGLVMRKRVMVLVDQTSHSKHAMMWALTHVTNRGDLLTLLHVIPPPSHLHDCSSNRSPVLANSLGALCKACRPEVCMKFVSSF